MGLLQVVLDAILPHHCAHCSAVGTPLCATCRAAIRFEALTTSNDLAHRITCTARLRDNPVLRSTIHALKYSGVHSLASILASSMRDTLLHTPHEQNVFVGNPILVPVPMWHTRQLARGYNQAHELARHLGLRCTLEVRNDILTRTRDTGSQVESASRDQRIAHMTGAFNSITPLPKRPLVIIDDVITTGATVAACRRALLDAGASEVRILGLAQG